MGKTIFKNLLPSGWNVLPLGAGGWLVGMDYIDDDNIVVRADTYGAYRWNGSRWIQLVTNTSIPSYEAGQGNGVYDIRINPFDNSKFIMIYLGKLYTSSNYGVTWTHRTDFPTDLTANANDSSRTFGGKICYDQTTSGRIFAGTPVNGLMRSTDGGINWDACSDVPLPDDRPSTEKTPIVVFVASNGYVYAGSWGNGTYRSTNNGVSFSALSGGPQKVKHFSENPDGSIWATNEDATGATAIWKLVGTTWTNISATATNYTVGEWHVAIHHSSTEIWFIEFGGGLDRTLNGGTSMEGIRYQDYPGHISYVANDIPWLATVEVYMSCGNAFKTETGDILMSAGVGVWRLPNGYPPLDFTPPLPNANSDINWTSQSLGIEQLVINEGIKPPGGPNLIGCWDRAVFTTNNYIQDVFPTEYGPTSEFCAGWSVDYAKIDPTYLFVHAVWGNCLSGWSNDGGATWNLFNALPPTMPVFGGTIAASTPDNICLFPNNNQRPYYTLDRGDTWTAISMPGVPTSGETGWGWAYYFKSRVCIADPVTSNVFYAYNYLHGIFKTTDGGANWTNVYSGPVCLFSGYNFKMIGVPGIAQTFVMTPGPQGTIGDTPSTMGLFITQNGGTTVTERTDIREVVCVGFGKNKTGKTTPACFTVGWVDYGSGYEYGVHRNDDVLDGGEPWHKIGDYPVGSLDGFMTIWGDMNNYGICHMGSSGSGCVYYGG